MKVYGLTTCDNTKAAIKWISRQKIPFQFHDYKLDGISNEKLHQWLKQLPIEKLLNKKSTTWRGLSDNQQRSADTEEGAVQLIIENTNLIKRPLVEWEKGNVTVGFDEKTFAGNL